MRTIRRISLPLNTGTWDALVTLVRCSTAEQDAHLMAVGQSDVFTDECGTRYGEGLGKVLSAASDPLTDQGRTRNRLHQRAKQAEGQGETAQARRVRTCNLGGKTLSATRRTVRGE